jgi:hypothetical protein
MRSTEVQVRHASLAARLPAPVHSSHFFVWPCAASHAHKSHSLFLRCDIMDASEDHVQRLTQKLADYILLYQQCSDKVRPYGCAQTDVIYDEAYKEWQSDPSNPLIEPPPGDRAKSDAYFATCDSICAIKPRNTHEYVPSRVSKLLQN